MYPLKRLCKKEGILVVIWRDHEDRVDGYVNTPPVSIDSDSPWMKIARCLFHIDDLARKTSSLMESVNGEHVHSLIGDKTPLGFVVGDYRAMVVRSTVIDFKVMVLIRKGDQSVTKSLQRMVRGVLKKVEREGADPWQASVE